jgi:predicted esterase
MRWTGVLALLLVLGLAAPRAHTDEPGPWAGEWVSDLGAMTLKQDGERVTGTYGEDGEVVGSAEGKKLSLTWTQGSGTGQGSFELGEDGSAFKGTWKSETGGGAWRGWRKDPQAEAAAPADFGGAWLSSLGPLQLEQKGTAVKGTYGAQGWGTIEGEVKGKRLHFTWKKLQWSGPAWLEQTADGKRLFGLTEEKPPTTWLGLRLAGFERHPKLKPGAIVEGRAGNGMLYFLHTPKSWKKGKPTDAVVLLHGSNWTTKGMVAVTARQPEIGDKYFVLGIQGEQWAPWSDLEDLRFNYTYVNWMGRSTYGGYPNTDRESPYLVAQVADELKAEHGLGRLFVGGHSQGGFLTYHLHMHFPEKWAGTFPMSCGLVMQAEPDVFKDKALLAAQRAIPLAVVHGTADDVVPYETGRSCHERFLAAGFPLLRHFAPPGGHAFDFLPVADVVKWLDVLSTKDATVLATFARERADAGAWRDVAAAVERAKVLKAETKVTDAAKRLDEAAKKDAPALLAKVKANTDGSWVDAYLAWQDQFEFAPSAKPLVDAYRGVQEDHDLVAEKRIGEARACFRAGDEEGGWAKYKEVVELYWGAKRYRTVKRWLADRK